MAVYFLDSSAVVKRYVVETGTAWVLGLTDPAAGNDLYLVSVTAIEVVSAIARRTRGGTLSERAASTASARFRHDLTNQYQVTAVVPSLINRAMSLAETHALRAYDALQLAAALELGERRAALGLASITLLSGDQDLSAAAVAEGMVVDDPNFHS